MNIIKEEYTHWFYHYNNKRNLYHALYNWGNIEIGYYYSNNRKGFWLNK